MSDSRDFVYLEVYEAARTYFDEAAVTEAQMAPFLEKY